MRQSISSLYELYHPLHVWPNGVVPYFKGDEGMWDPFHLHLLQFLSLVENNSGSGGPSYVASCIVTGGPASCAKSVVTGQASLIGVCIVTGQASLIGVCIVTGQASVIGELISSWSASCIGGGATSDSRDRLFATCSHIPCEIAFRAKVLLL